MAEMVNTGARERNRVARHSQLVAAASAIVDEKGLESLTMQDVAAHVECAVGTIYTYFNSKSALLAALQGNAMAVLAESYEHASRQWDVEFKSRELSERVESLVRLIGFTRLFVTWPMLQPREFEFLQMLVRAPGRVLQPSDLASVLPLALALFAEGRVTHDAAVASGALLQDPDNPSDCSTARTVRWIALVQGAVTISSVTENLPAELSDEAYDRELIADYGMRDQLQAWGGDPVEIRAAFAVADEMALSGSLFPDSVANPLIAA